MLFATCALCQDECVQNPTVINQYFGQDNSPNIPCKTECTPGLPGKSGPKGEAGQKGEAGEKGADGQCICDGLENELLTLKRQLTVDECQSNPCHNEGTCVDKYNSYQCICKEGYFGSNCAKVYASCKELRSVYNSTGVYSIKPFPDEDPIQVMCDMETDGGGWIVFQHRFNGLLDFERGWSEYTNGFGDKRSEFWLGLEILHKLTRNTPTEMRVDLEDFDGVRRFAKYSVFQVDGSITYRLRISQHSGDAGNGFAHANGMAFSTKDRDQDTYNNNCAQKYRGAWWYHACHDANLNGLYGAGVNSNSYNRWSPFRGSNSLKSSKMMIRAT